jgi:hypothetical protein
MFRLSSVILIEMFYQLYMSFSFSIKPEHLMKAAYYLALFECNVK